MASDNNYATWLMYLIVLNVISAVVITAILGIVDIGGQFANTDNMITDSATSGIPTLTNSSANAFGMNMPNVDFSFWATFITSVLLVPVNLAAYAPPIGIIVVIFYALIKLGIVICIWKVVNPVSSG